MVEQIPLVVENNIYYVKARFVLELAQSLLKVSDNPKKINRLAHALIDTYLIISDEQEKLTKNTEEDAKSHRDDGGIGFKVSESSNTPDDDEDDDDDE